MRHCCHIHAAAGSDGTVSVDLAAVHGKGTIIVHKHATAVCRDIALDGTAVHSEGALIHIYARAIITCHTIAADGAAVHVEHTAVVYCHAPADVRTAVRDDAAVDCNGTTLAQDPPVAAIAGFSKPVFTAAAVAVGQCEAAVAHNVDRRLVRIANNAVTVEVQRQLACHFISG